MLGVEGLPLDWVDLLEGLAVDLLDGWADSLEGLVADLVGLVDWVGVRC